MLRVVSAIFFMICFAAGAVHGQSDPPSFPPLKEFEPGSGRLWFSGCEYEAERYITCKTAQPEILAAISQPGDQTAGGALQTFISDAFIEKGCAFEAPLESFRVNGVFLSFDTKAAAKIRCGGKPGAISFAPDGLKLLDTLYFFSGYPPQ